MNKTIRNITLGSMIIALGAITVKLIKKDKKNIKINKTSDNNERKYYTIGYTDVNKNITEFEDTNIDNIESIEKSKIYSLYNQKSV